METEPQIRATLQNYFDGLFRGDAELLKMAFHPQAQLFGEVRGKPYQKSLEGFLAATTSRRSPRDAGEEFHMEVLNMEATSNVAYVRARCPMFGLAYIDHLALARDGDRWLIVNKLFTHE